MDRCAASLKDGVEAERWSLSAECSESRGGAQNRIWRLKNRARLEGSIWLRENLVDQG